MKPKSSRYVALSSASKPFLLAVACSIGAASFSPVAFAAILTYDADTTAPANDGAGVWDTTTPNWFDGANDVVWPNTTGDTAIFGAAAAGTGGAVVVSAVNVGLIQFNPQTTTGYTLSGGPITLGSGIDTTSAVGNTISAIITGSNGLAFNGVLNSQTGLTLSGANDYTGITSLSTGGRITANNGTALGSSAGATVSDLGTNYTLINALTTVTVGNSTSEAFLINGQGSIASGNAPGGLRLVNGITLSSFVQLGSNAQLSGNFGTNNLNGNLDLADFTLAVGNGNNSITATVNGLLTGSSSSILDIGANGGSNVVNLTNNANTFSGTVRVNGSSGSSTVGLGGDTVLGSGSLVFANGGVRSTNATARTISNVIGTFPGAGGSTATFGATTTQTGTLNFTNTGNTSLGTATRTLATNVNTTIAAELSNTAQIIKSGAATLFLTNTASIRTGATTINAGILNVANLVNGGAGNFSSIGASANTAGSLVLGGGTLQFTGSSPQSTDRLFTVAASAAVPPTSSAIDASGSAPAASLVFTNAGAIGQGDLTRVVNLPIGTTTVTGLLSTANLKVGARVTGTNIAANTTIASITDATTIVLSLPTTNVAVANNITLTFTSVDRSLALTGSNTGANSIAGILSDRTVATFPTGVLSLSKTGTGSWALSGANTYTGGTAVTTGTLLANNLTGSGTGTGAVTVDSGAKFGGNGTVTGPVNVASGGGLAFVVNSLVAGHNSFDITGALSLPAASSVTILEGTGVEVGLYTLATATGGITGTLPTLVTPVGVTGNLIISGNNLQLNVTAVSANDFDTWIAQFPSITGADKLATEGN